MGSVIITIKDIDDGIDVSMGFDPPIDDMEEITSLAHAVAINFVEYAASAYADEEDEDLEDES